MKILFTKKNMMLLLCVLILTVFAVVSIKYNHIPSDVKPVSEMFPELIGEENDGLYLSTYITYYYENSWESKDNIYKDFLDIKIKTKPESDVLYTKEDSVHLLEFSYSAANDYYSPGYVHTICFSEDFNELWIAREGEGGYKYRVYEPEKVKSLFSLFDYYTVMSRYNDKERLENLYTYKENVVDITFKFSSDLLPKIDSDKFTKYENGSLRYEPDKDEGVIYKEENSIIKITDIFCFNESDKVFVIIEIEHEIPNEGSVLYASFTESERDEELSSMQNGVDIKCGEKVYEKAFDASISNRELYVMIDKDIYGELDGEIEIEFPMVNMELKRK